MFEGEIDYDDKDYDSETETYERDINLCEWESD